MAAQRCCSSPQPSSTYSREIDDESTIDDTPSPSPTQRPSTPRAGAAMSNFARAQATGPSATIRDSGIGTEYVAMQYGHPLNRDGPRTVADVTQAFASQETGAGGPPASTELSSVFVFGAGAKQVVPAQDEAPPAKKRKRWSTNFWAGKSKAREVEAAATAATHADDGVEMPAPRPSRFRRIRKSVGDISASLLEIAGRKRSREEGGHGVAASERAGKIARAELPPSRKGSDVPFPLQVRTPSPPPASTPLGSPAYGLCLSDPEIADIVRVLRQGPSVVPSYDMAWTPEERTVFGAYVRAAEDLGWEMDFS